MRALMYTAPERMEILEVPRPELEPGEVLIKVAYSGICGSELSGYMGKNSLRKPPLIFGHEFSGWIVDPGTTGQEAGLQEGMRVTANPLITCGTCAHCVAGQESLCASRKLISAALPGSNAEYVKIPVEQVHKLPDHVSMEQGALVEPIACGVRVAELANVGKQDTVLVTGMGPIGVFSLQALLLKGVGKVIVSDLSEDRLEFAASLGAETINPKKEDFNQRLLELTGGAGVDAAVDAVGSSITRRQCAESLRAGGRIVMTGLHTAESSLDFNDLVRKELVISGSFAYSKANFSQALEWISTGRIGLGDRIVIAPLSSGTKWFDQLVHKPGREIKVLLKVEEV